jgi:AraC-like DNA-binding protein
MKTPQTSNFQTRVAALSQIIDCLELTGKLRENLLGIVQVSIETKAWKDLDGQDLNALKIEANQLSQACQASVSQIFYSFDQSPRIPSEVPSSDYVHTLINHLNEQKRSEQDFAAQLQNLTGIARHHLSDLSHYHLDFLGEAHLLRVFRYIEANYHKTIGLREVAEALGYSSAYLTNFVRRKTGKPVNQWIVRRRLAEACHLLLTTSHSIETIAFGVGYQNIEHFFRQFRKYINMTPQNWRNTERGRFKFESMANGANLVRKVLLGE